MARALRLELRLKVLETFVLPLYYARIEWTAKIEVYIDIFKIVFEKK